MILYAFDIPESHDDRAKWLERMVTGLHLSELVGELRAVHGSQGKEKDLSAIVGNQLAVLLERGVSELSGNQLQSLLTNPNALFELQEVVLVKGSSYWQSVAEQQDELGQVVGSGAPIVRATTGSTPSDTGRPTVQPLSVIEKKAAWYKHPLLVALTTAAVVLVAVNLREHFAPQKNVKPTQVAAAKTGWGWNRPGTIKSDLAADQYLHSLADTADEWFDQRPKTARDLAVRIAQFRQGCSTLILADHQSLAEDDKMWLVEKCRAWAGKLDKHLKAIEAGEPVMAVREAADETIRKLQTAMRARADEIRVG